MPQAEHQFERFAPIRCRKSAPKRITMATASH